MSVLIKDMKMPKWCEECRFYDAPYCAALGIGIEDMNGPYRPHDYCPLVEVPTSHGKLIDADALSARMYHEAFEVDSDMQKWDSGCWIRYKMFERIIGTAPIVIEIEE